MRNRLLEETFPEIVDPALVDHLSSRTSDFAKLVREFGLDPKRDFRHSDLTGVDFSGANLRGYDFTGADLRGSFGIGASIEGAILAEAQLAGSLFEYRSQRAAFFAGNPEAARMLRSLSVEHWTNATLWVAEQVLRRKREDAIEIAKALFLDTKESVLRNQILFFLARAFDDRPAYLAFLLETLAGHGDKIAVRRSVTKLLGQLFYNHRSVFEVMKRELQDDRLADPREVLVALARSTFSRAEFGTLSTLVQANVEPANRRLFIRAYVKFRGHEFALLLDDKALAQTLDFGATISDRLIQSAARSIVNRSSSEEREGGLDAFERAIDRKAVQLRAGLFQLSDVGLNLTIEPPLFRERKPRRDREERAFRVPEGRRILEG